MALREGIVAAAVVVRVERFPLAVVEAVAAPSPPPVVAEEAVIAVVSVVAEEVTPVEDEAVVTFEDVHVVAAVHAVVGVTMAQLSTR